MYKQNSKEIARIENTAGSAIFIRLLRACLNTARYKVRVRGRKPDKAMMKADGLHKHYYKRDGDIPRKHATELAIYLNGVITHECDVCDVIKENLGLRGRLFEARAKLVEVEKENKRLGVEVDRADHKIEVWRKYNVRADKINNGLNKLNLGLREELELANARVSIRKQHIKHLRERISSLGEEAKAQWCTIETLRKNGDEVIVQRRLIAAYEKKSLIECLVDGLSKSYRSRFCK